MTTIKLEIKNCKECPHFDSKRHYTADSWEHVENWFCTHNNTKVKIAEYVEWTDEKHLSVPEWCPIKI